MKRQQNKKAKNYDNQPQENNNNLNNIMGRSCNRKQHQNFPQQSVGKILGKNKNKMERGLPVKISICYDLNHFVDLLHSLFQS